MNFEEAIAELQVVNVARITENIDKKVDFIAFMGFAGCPFCQRFAPKLKEALAGRNAYFIPSREVSEMENITVFRQAYNIPTVPALLVAKDGELKVVCDSSLSIEDIKEFIK